MTPETFVLSVAASATILIFADFFTKFVGWWRSRKRKRELSVDEVLPACRYELPDGTVVRVISVSMYSSSMVLKSEVRYYVDDEWTRWQEELEVDAAAAEPQTFTVKHDAFVSKCRPYVEVGGQGSRAGGAPAGALSLVPRPKRFKFRRWKGTGTGTELRERDPWKNKV